MSTPAVKITFDTHAYVRILKGAGFTETQAEGLSDGLALAMTQGVATHDDIVGLNGRIDTLDTKIGALDAKVDHVQETLSAKSDHIQETLSAKSDHIQETLNAKIDHVLETLSAKIDSAQDKVVIRLGMFMTALVTVAVAVLSLIHH